jgi:hypothetical protein
MSKPIRPIKVLLYEDKKEYQDSFKVAARAERIITEVVDNVEDLLETITSNPKKYQFIVLDARAYLKEGQQEGTEDEANLTKILLELNKLKYTGGPTIPYCVNTGFADIKLRIKATIDCPIFEKGDEENLFKHIWATYNDTDNAKLRFKYPKVFEFVDSQFSDPNIEVLSSLLLNDKYTSAQLADRVNNLSTLRNISEHIMDILHNKYLNGIPDMSGNLGGRLGAIAKHMFDTKDMPVHVHGTLISIRKVANEYGSHSPQQAQNIADYPGAYTITGLTLGLFDVLAWAQTKV